MTRCSDCYWFEQCGCLTNTCCEDYTSLEEISPQEEAAYLATVRADCAKNDVTTPDDYDVWGVRYKLRDSTQHLLL